MRRQGERLGDIAVTSIAKTRTPPPCRQSAASRLFRPLALCVMAIAIVACSKQTDTKETHLSRANDYFAAEQYDKAEKEYRDVLRLAPADPVAVRQLGIIYDDQGQILQAYPLLKKSAELEPDNLEVQFRLGQLNLSIHKMKEARDAALQILDKQPGNERALVLLADTAVAPDDIEETRKLVESLREKDHDRAGYHLALGVLDLAANDPARAESEFKSALQLDPKSSVVHSALGTFYWKRNDLKAANQAFKAAADLAPARSPIRLRYANFLIETGAVPEAKKILEDINRKFPDFLPPRVSLMKLACAAHQDEDCTTRVQSILAQDPVNPDGVYQDAVLRLAKGDAATAARELEYMRNTYTQNSPVRYQLALAYLLLAKTASPDDSRKALEGAENSLTEAVKLNPHFAQAVLLLSELKIRKGVPSAAVDLLTPLTKEQPPIAQAYYLLGSAYLAQQQTSQALAVYRQMTELFPKDPQPSYLVGTILLGQHQPAAARQALEKSLEISPDYLRATERLVDLDIADKQYAAALDRVQKYIDKDPKSAQAWGLKGKIYFAQRDFAHAEPDLLKAVELDPKLEPAYLLLARLYVVSNKQEEAIAKLNAFVEQNKDENNKIVPALLQLAMIQQNLKHFSEARDAYEKVLAISPSFALALNNLAVLYSENLGQLDKAYDLAKKASETAPNEPHLTDTLGWILFKKGNYDKAIPLLQESANKVPDSAEIQFHVGMAHYMLGQEESSRIALQKAADASADFPGKDEARRRLAMLAIDVKTANAADLQKELENDLREQPNDPVALLRLAQLQERAGAIDAAVKTYQKIIDGDASFAPATRRLAILYSQRPADEAKALDLATKARQAYPDDPALTKILGILNYQRGYYPQSVELLKLAAAKTADDPELLYYLGQTYHQLKQWNECKETLRHAVSMNLPPKLSEAAKPALADCSAELNKDKGIESYRSGDYPLSETLLKQAAAERKDDPELLYYLGQAYHQLKQLNECRDTLQRALNLKLSPKLADDAKRALADCS